MISSKILKYFSASGLLLSGLLCVPQVYSSEVDSLIETKVTSTEDHYVAELSFEVMDANPGQIKELLTDYANLSRIDPGILQSRVLKESTNERVRVLVEARDCVMFFCKTVTRVEEVHQPSKNVIVAETIPELSDFAEGTATWVFRQTATGTQVKYHATIRPDFWMPPIIGSRITRNIIRKHLITTAEHIQQWDYKTVL